MSSEAMRVERLVVRSRDGFHVPVRQHEPAPKPWAVVLLSAATGAPQRFYSPFAQWLAAAGVRVLTYDYRGVGDARPSALRGFDADLLDWAEDARAVVRFASESGAGCPLVLVGHSFGGQLLGLVDEMEAAAGVLMVGATLAHWRHWRGLARARVLAFWELSIPLTTRLFGYLPGWAGVGVDLPAGVARQWRRWAQHPEYLLAHEPLALERFRRYSGPVLAYSFADDAIAPVPAVRHLLSALNTPWLEHRHVDPASLGRTSVGHFGFFRTELRDALWPEALEFVRGAARHGAALRAPRLPPPSVRPLAARTLRPTQPEAM